MSAEDEEHYRNNYKCRFCWKEVIPHEVWDHCHFTGKYRVPAHNSCNKNVTEKQSNFLLFLIHNFSNFDCHLFFKKLPDKNIDKVNIDITPRTNEENISVTYGFIRFSDSYKFLSSSWDSQVKTSDDNSHKTRKTLKKEIVDVDEILNIVNEIETIIKEDRYIKDSIKDIKKDFPGEIEKLEEALNIYMSKNDP